MCERIKQKNRKKHERRRLRQAEKYWTTRIESGCCPLCKETTTTKYMCDVCGPHHTVFITEAENNLQVWIYKGIPNCFF